MNKQLKGLQKQVKKLSDGSTVAYYYWRNPRVRLPGQYGSPEFLKAYVELQQNAKVIVEKAAPERAKTIGFLIDKFKDSTAFRSLADSTRQIMKYNLASVEELWGTLPIEALVDKGVRSDMLDWHNEMAKEHPRAADNKLAAFQRVLSWALSREMIDKNPIASFERAYDSDRSDKIWLPEHVTAFAEAAPKELLLALFLALHTGQRQGDLLKVRWSQYDGTGLNVKQGKGDNWVYVPCTKKLKLLLDEMPRTADTILTTATGESWKKEQQFRRAWLEAKSACKAVEDLNFHDLRGTAVTMLSEAGCTTQEVAAITGHSLKGVENILSRYLAKTKALAQNAIAKFDEHEPLNLASPKL